MPVKRAFSLVEVIVSAVIFTVTLAGVFGAVRSMANHPVSQVTTDVQAVLYGQKFLQVLRGQVAVGGWSAPSYNPGSHDIPPDGNFVGYNGTYTIVLNNDVYGVTLNIISP